MTLFHILHSIQQNKLFTELYQSCFNIDSFENGLKARDLPPVLTITTHAPSEILIEGIQVAGAPTLAVKILVDPLAFQFGLSQTVPNLPFAELSQRLLGHRSIPRFLSVDLLPVLRQSLKSLGR